MKKNYQTKAATVATDDSIAVAEAVAVTITELTGARRRACWP